MLSLVFLLGGAVGQTPASKIQPDKEQAKTAERVSGPVTNLDFLLDMKDLQNPMTLKEALARIEDQVAAKGRHISIFVDAEAFKEENPDAPSIYDTQTLFPAYPKHMRLQTALRLLLARVSPPNATYILRDGMVEITTYLRSGRDALLRQRISADFKQRPLADVLHELAERSGVSVVVDPRTGERAKTAVSATFRGDISLEAALRLLADLAELKAVVLPSGTYVTTPENAERIGKEQKRWLVPPNAEPGGTRLAPGA
jgi:hypothetical protein